VDLSIAALISPIQLLPVMIFPSGESETVITRTQFWNDRGASVYLFGDNWSLVANIPLTIKYFFDVMDGGYATYSLKSSNDSLPDSSQGIRRVMRDYLIQHGVHPKNGAFSLEDISALLEENNLSEFLDGVDPANQTAATLHIFSKYCLSCFNFIQISPNYDKEGNLLHAREGQPRWALAFFVDLGRSIGTCRQKIDGAFLDGTPTPCAKFLFIPIYHEHRMQFLTAYPISPGEFKGASRGGLFYLRTRGKRL
jgi:hypothetical protein